MNKKSKIAAIAAIAAITAVLSVIPSQAFAFIPDYLKEYRTWGDFEIIVDTFHRLALMMSSTKYHGVMFGIVVISIIINVSNTIIKGGNPRMWFSAIGSILLGIVIYTAFIVPKTEISIYDEESNQVQIIADVPEGIVFLTGMESLIRGGLTDIIWTSGNVNSYKSNAGGRLIKILGEAIGSGGSGDKYLDNSLERYVDDCLVFELSRPGTNLNINDFDDACDFSPLLEHAKNPAITTVFYNNSNSSGLTMSCEDAMTAINLELAGYTEDDSRVKDFWKNTVGKAGISPNAFNETRTMAVDYLNDKISAGMIDSAQILKQNAIYNAIKSGDTVFETNRRQMISMYGAAVLANEWLPIMKGTVFATFVGIMPFLFLMLPTGLISKILSFVLGTFVFFVSWGTCDAILHSMAAGRVDDLIRGSGCLGMLMIEDFTSITQKAAVSFGAARLSGMMIAGILAGLFTKFGGSQFAHFQNQMLGREAATKAAHDTKDYAQQATAMDNMSNASATNDIHSSFGNERLSEAAFRKREVDTNSWEKTAAMAGSGGMASTLMSSGNAAANITGSKTKIGRASGAMAHEGATGKSMIDTTAASTELDMSRNYAEANAMKNASGGNVMNTLAPMADYKAGNQAMQARQYSHNAKQEGVSAAALGGRTGLSEAATNIGRGNVAKNLGRHMVDHAEVNQLGMHSRTALTQATNDIARSGQIGANTSDYINDIASTRNGMAALASNGGVQRAIQPGQEALNVSRYLNEISNGEMNVNPELLGGTTANFDFYRGDNGNMNLAFVATKDGTSMASYDTHRTEVSTAGGAYQINRSTSGYLASSRGISGSSMDTNNLSTNRYEDNGGAVTETLSQDGRVLSSRGISGSSMETNNLSTNRYEDERGAVTETLSQDGRVLNSSAVRGEDKTVNKDFTRYNEGLDLKYSTLNNSFKQHAKEIYQYHGYKGENLDEMSNQYAAHASSMMSDGQKIGRMVDPRAMVGAATMGMAEATRFELGEKAADLASHYGSEMKEAGSTAMEVLSYMPNNIGATLGNKAASKVVGVKY
ncbi:MAG: conjugal transfer protein TraG [bacterium]|nr:conjugal transfer protein TraG [bacterium]